MGGRQRKLVRRKKQPIEWDLEESRNSVYQPKPTEAVVESRALRPVKIKRRKIVNGKPQKQIIRKILPQSNPSQPRYPQTILAVNNITETVAPKPDEAKRCKWVKRSNIKTNWFCYSLVSVHHCILQE